MDKRYRLLFTQVKCPCGAQVEVYESDAGGLGIQHELPKCEHVLTMSIKDYVKTLYVGVVS